MKESAEADSARDTNDDSRDPGSRGGVRPPRRARETAPASA
jgi:hypothetical protein